VTGPVREGHVELCPTCAGPVNATGTGTAAEAFIVMYDVSSNGIATMASQDTYYVLKYPDHIRKQWTLSVSDPRCLEIAAYFRSEEHARRFARTFGLTLTDHRGGA
jgi:hypothetical protein